MFTVSKNMGTLLYESSLISIYRRSTETDHTQNCVRLFQNDISVFFLRVVYLKIKKTHHLLKSFPIVRDRMSSKFFFKNQNRVTCTEICNYLEITNNKNTIFSLPLQWISRFFFFFIWYLSLYKFSLTKKFINLMKMIKTALKVGDDQNIHNY